ncbi:MAG: hypothetical protein LBF91_03520 [Azoarcus sp.]|nr:hypothetical protein [Azoarcus sp.]
MPTSPASRQRFSIVPASGWTTFAHFSSTKRETPLAREAWRIEWREAAGELGARLYELELAAARRRASEDLCSWQLVRHGDGDFRPALVFARDVDFARAEDLYGLYRGPREAVSALRKLAQAYRLCHHFTGLADGRAGEACIAHGQGSCRGACVGREAISLHSARLMTALAKHRVRPWPYPGPIALVERDEFGMREDAHIIDAWGYLGTAGDEVTLGALFASAADRQDSGRSRFDADVYRIVGKCLREGRLRVIAAPR